MTCPVQFHFGRRDTFVPLEGVDAVQATFENRDDVEVHLYDAGHAFDNLHAPSMHDPAAADDAWDRTIGFVHRHLDRTERR